MTDTAVHETNLEFPLVRRGKVRDVYRAPRPLANHLLVATTNRVSVFDVVLQDPIPGKGKVLTAMSRHFLALLQSWIGVENHLVDIEIASALVGLVERDHPELAGQVSVWRRVQPVMAELIVRRHITGSFFRAYKSGERNILGHQFPDGLADGADLGKVIFTPSTKAEKGHDENITEAAYSSLVEKQFPQQGKELAEYLRDKVLAAGRQTYDYCQERGIVLLDSKFEFGVVSPGEKVEVLIIDEAVTSDSSRFCKMADWEVGNLVAYDKELVRQYVLQQAERAGLSLGSEGFEVFVSELRLPTEIIDKTAERYREIGEILMS